MGDIFELANTLAILTVGRQPKWTVQAEAGIPQFPNGPPLNANAGVFLENSPTTLLSVKVREQVQQRTLRIEITTLNLTDTYTLTLPGPTAFAFDAGAAAATDLADLISKWAIALQGDAPFSAIATATAIASIAGGTVDRLKLQGVGVPDYSLTVATSTTAVLNVISDAESVDFRIFVSDRGPNAPSSFDLVSNGTVTGVGFRGFTDRLETAGLFNGYVEIFTVVPVTGDSIPGPHSVEYRPVVTFGPSILE